MLFSSKVNQGARKKNNVDLCSQQKKHAELAFMDAKVRKTPQNFWKQQFYAKLLQTLYSNNPFDDFQMDYFE